MAPSSRFLTSARAEADPAEPRSPPDHPSPAGPRALRLSPLGERVPAPPTEPGTPFPSRAPTGPPPLSPRRGLAGRAGPGASARAGAFGLGGVATAPAPEPCPSEACPRELSVSSPGPPPPPPSPGLRSRGAARKQRHVLGWGRYPRLKLRGSRAPPAPARSGLGPPFGCRRRPPPLGAL